MTFDIVPVLVIALVCLLLGAGGGWWAASSRTGVQTAELRSEVSGLTAQLDRADAQILREQESAQQAHEAIAAMRTAERARIERASSEEERNHRVVEALAPVAAQLDQMRRSVSAMEEQRAQQFGEIAEQMRHHAEMGNHLRGTTESLASALRSTTARGSWGEVQLRNVVQAAGLLDRVDFAEQSVVATEAGSKRPDLVINLPGGAHLALDAKAPLGSYLEASAVEGTDASAEAARAELLTKHVAALRRHVDELASRDYASAFRSSPSLVIAFIPSESALSAAIATDAGLLDYAFGKGIALTSPVSLWSTLKAVAAAWRHEQLTESAEEVIKLGSQLTQRLGTVSSHLDKLGRSLDAAVDSYNQAIGSIESRVLPTARKLAALEGTESPTTPRQLESTSRALTAPELTDSSQDFAPAPTGSPHS